ncbi:MAG: FHA domain-containing protein, partial [Candidatus Aminicenantes bacterium]|nr:FHA domain-containing protein [Candidatus Aminicenantes bacterium]
KEDEEKYISRKHSKISFQNGKFYISEEPGAVNGTFLNSERLATGVKHELKNEDEVTLCHLKILFKH